MQTIFIKHQDGTVMFTLVKDPNLKHNDYITDNGTKIAWVESKSFDKALNAVIYDCYPIDITNKDREDI